MIFLNREEEKHLYKIKDTIDASSPSIESLKELCDGIAPHLINHRFPYTYAAILLAIEGRVDDAILFLTYNVEDIFSSVLGDFLRDTGTLNSGEVVFQNTSPYNAFVKTNFFNEYQRGILRYIRKFAASVPPPTSDGTATILDMGTGNGILISKIVEKIIPINGLKRIRLILLDPSESMLCSAEKNCRQNINIQMDIVTICCRAEDMDEGQIGFICEMKPIWFTNASLSLHHMPSEVKIPLFRQLRKLAPYCILSELNWNNDSPEAKSPELIYSIVNGYGLLFKNILESPITEKEKKSTIHKFLLAEAIRMIKETRSNRTDYHTTIEEWKKIGNKANFDVSNTTTVYRFADGQPAAFVMTFCPCQRRQYAPSH